MVKPLTQEEEEQWWWVQDMVTDVDAPDVAEDSGVSLRTIQRIYGNSEYVPSRKTREKLTKWAIDLVESERSDCPW